MNLIRRRNEGGGLASLQRDLNSFFDSFFDSEPWDRSAGWMPPMEIEESQEELVIRAEVPGMKSEDVEISLHGNTLTITGEKKSQRENKNGGYYQSERRYGRFQRVLSLPSDVDAEKIEATQNEGVLTVRLPKSEAAKPRKIEVKG